MDRRVWDCGEIGSEIMYRSGEPESVLNLGC